MSLPTAKPGAAPPLLGVHHVHLPSQGDGMCAALRELGALHASHTHAREAGIQEVATSLGVEKGVGICFVRGLFVPHLTGSSQQTL